MRGHLPYNVSVMAKRSWTETQLRKAVKKSPSYRQVLSSLGLKEAGGNYEQLKKYIKEYKLDTKHFKGQAWNKGLKGIGKFRLPLKKILVKNNSYQSYKAIISTDSISSEECFCTYEKE